MTQVSNQAELQAALNALESSIQVTAGFSIASQIIVHYKVTIESLSPDSPATLTKDSSYFTYLFRIMEGGSLTLQNIILDGNSDAHPAENENNRSLVYVTGGALHLLEGSVLQNNNAWLEGGGVYLNSSASYSSSFFMNGNSRITGCYSRLNGGGIMLAIKNGQDNYSISGNALIDYNRAANGGGIYCRSYTAGTSSSLTLGGQVQITGNVARNAGGGIYFSGNLNGESSPSVLTLTENSVFSNNQAADGGGIYVYSVNTGNRLVLSGNASVTQNTASQNGGGCYLTGSGSGAAFSMENASITDNTAGTGGGIYLFTDSGGAVTILQGTITGNRAVNGEAGTGGGIRVQNRTGSFGVTVLIQNTILSQNEASAHGGGMALYGGPGSFSLDMTGCTVEENSSGQNGGGLLISNDDAGTLSFLRSAISQNRAAGSGGGIYYANTGEGQTSSLTMTDTDISHNTAGFEGGGLRLTSGNGVLHTHIADCTVTSNTAQSNSGGGIFNGGMNNVLSLSGNSAITENSSDGGNGGGIYFNSALGSLHLSGNVKVNGNRADAVSTDFGNHGGGICLVPGILTVLENVEIAYNHAGKYGGAVSAAEKSQVFIAGGIIHDNSSAIFGGGIWNHNDSSVTVSDGGFSNNQAPYGGGIYNDSSLYMEGLRLISDGVLIENRNAVVRLRAALTSGSSIPLENSLYVIPNAEGIPVVVAEATSLYPLLSQADADAFFKPAEHFDGWEIRLSEDNTQVLLAPAVYLIQYENLMGAENSNPSIYTVTTPDIHLLSPAPLTGYRFIGWFDAPDGGNQVTVIPQGSTGNITLYAGWEVIPSYTITFHGNDACCPKACRIPEPLTGYQGQSITLPDTLPVRTGYCFSAWNTDCCGCGKSLLPGETLSSPEGDMCLYAIWKKKRCRCGCP